eukprot:TRINITY_DN81394_c0_g1_i1.p1 TRINITY_DN81394_c0_g1~~TRINITY_DN81394_c0_g1_i1.p1  ORF type:complete len:879 (+),score=131.42 TRINITY_DN81394_c0_g1_i1:3-2639(+)
MNDGYSRLDRVSGDFGRAGGGGYGYGIPDSPRSQAETLPSQLHLPQALDIPSEIPVKAYSAPHREGGALSSRPSVEARYDVRSTGLQAINAQALPSRAHLDHQIAEPVTRAATFSPHVVSRSVSVKPVTAAGTIAPAVALGQPMSQPLARAQSWVTNSAPQPVMRTPVITYPSGAVVNVQEFSQVLAPFASANAVHRARMIPAIESGDLQRQTLQTYLACDRTRSGFLQWQTGEIQSFLASIFSQQGLAPPSDSDMYALYTRFDADRNSMLDARECLCLVDALMRAVFFAEVPHYGAPHVQAFPSVVPARVIGGSSISTRPASFAPPVLPGSAGIVPITYAPSPTSFMPQALPHSLSIPSTRAASAHVLPSHALVGSHHMLGDDIHNLPYTPSVVHPASHPVLHPTSVRRLPAHSHSAAPHSIRGQQEPLPGPPPPPEVPDGHVGIPHAIEDMGKQSRGTKGAPAPKPPKWHEHEQRHHVLEVFLDELELHPNSPDLTPGWFESLTYFVSLHPRSEDPESIPLPRDAPERTIDGEFMVSSTQAARLPAVEVGLFRGPEDDEDSDDHRSKAKKKTQHPTVDFKEKMEIFLDRLDTYLVAFVWARKTSLGGSTVTLVGRALAPLHEFKLQRKSTTWGVFDVLEGHRVAEMRLRYAASTTPGPVQQPGVADCKQTEVTVKWSPPQNDHGAKVIGYQVSILLDSKAHNEGPQWHTLCECTKSLNPVYVIANLSGNTAYLVNIRAVNKVGPGDACDFQITTAPTEPEPPSKPWIEEARDGCLNVAWYPPENDGGIPITSYRVRMRKIIGASKWNPFGPGDHTADWVDMGSVGAAMNPQQGAQPMYNAWVGPLESTTCEYRFAVHAKNHNGESRPSELSDPHYT